METLHEKYGTIEETLAALREQLGYGQLEQQRDVSAPQQAIGKLEQESSPAAELAEERYDDLAAPRESPDEGREEGAGEAAEDREWEEFKRTQSLNLRRQLSARRTTDLVGDPVGGDQPSPDRLCRRRNPQLSHRGGLRSGGGTHRDEGRLSRPVREALGGWLVVQRAVRSPSWSWGGTTPLSASTRSHRPRHSGLCLCLRRSGVQERQEASHRASC